MEPKLRATWLRAFDATPEGEPTRKCLTAVEQLGKQQLEDGLQRWVGMLAGEPGPALSPIGSAICRHVVVLCGLLGGDAAATSCTGLPSPAGRASRMSNGYLHTCA